MTITQTNWFRKYSVSITDEEIVVDFPTYHKVYKVGDLGSVWVDGTAVTRHYGTTTENILTGAALGGRVGAFVGALSKTGERTYSTSLSLIICRRMPDQVYFGGPMILYTEAFREALRLPATPQFEKFASAVIEAANRVIVAQNTRPD